MVMAKLCFQDCPVYKRGRIYLVQGQNGYLQALELELKILTKFMVPNL